jgi:hypothetical protein
MVELPSSDLSYSRRRAGSLGATLSLSHTPQFRRRLTAASVGVLACISIAGYAAAGAFNPGNAPASQVARVGRICESVIGLEPGEEHYYGCVESLSNSLQKLSQGGAVQQAHADCLDRGFRPDSPGLAECVLKSADDGPYPARETSELGNSGAMDEPGGSKSYFSASPHTAFQRERLACARLGFDPAYSAFDSCVADLASTLFGADNPMN